jgi:hypothetical protein
VLPRNTSPGAGGGAYPYGIAVTTEPRLHLAEIGQHALPTALPITHKQKVLVPFYPCVTVGRAPLYVPRWKLVPTSFHPPMPTRMCSSKFYVPHRPRPILRVHQLGRAQERSPCIKGSAEIQFIDRRSLIEIKWSP